MVAYKSSSFEQEVTDVEFCHVQVLSLLRKQRANFSFFLSNGDRRNRGK